nr:EOG090X03V0 [Lepidurus arcticus]
MQKLLSQRQDQRDRQHHPLMVSQINLDHSRHNSLVWQAAYCQNMRCCVDKPATPRPTRPTRPPTTQIPQERKPNEDPSASAASSLSSQATTAVTQKSTMTSTDKPSTTVTTTTTQKPTTTSPSTTTTRPPTTSLTTMQKVTQTTLPTTTTTVASTTTTTTTRKPTTTTTIRTTTRPMTQTTAKTTPKMTTTTSTTTTAKPKTSKPITTTTDGATEEEDLEEVEEEEFEEEVAVTDKSSLPALPDAQAYSSNGVRVCPGVCVASRISAYCEAVLNVDGLCKTDLRCCVSKDLFGDRRPPPELVILNGGGTHSHDPNKPPMPQTPPMIPTVSSISTSSSSSPSTPTAVSTTQAPPTQRVQQSQETTTTLSPNIPDNRRCIGTCVTGFFSYLCDFVDPRAMCPNGGRCCVNRKEGPSDPNNRPPAGTQNPPPTRSPSPPNRPVSKSPPPLPTTTTTTTPKPIPTTTRPIRCPGVCMNALMAAVICSRPSIILPDRKLCETGSVCCAPDRQVPSGAPKPSGGLSDIPLGSIFEALLPRPSPIAPVRNQDKADLPPPTQRPPPTARPTPPKVFTTTEAVVDSRPMCPGTCIAPFLSFTCFSNAEITDLFKCPSPKVSCCAPKSSIKDLRPEAEISMNETFFTRPAPGPGFQGPPYQEQPPQLQPYQPQPSYPSPSPSNSLVPVNAAQPTTKAPYNNKFVCGVKGTSRNARVVGGEDALPGEYCWQVALINSLNQYLCGGALIGTQWILTAAHCVTNIVRSGDAIYVRVGDHDLTSKYGSPGAQTLRVATTYIHHNHNSQTLDNDIALLKLHGQAELKPGVCLACLPSRGASQEPGKRCTVTGYGYMGETGPIPLRVREAEVPVVSDGECVRKINAVTEKIFILPASSFCAGGENGNDACQGDGGGPLVCEDDGYYELTGLVSWGFGCGRADVPGVYVKVSSFISWINQIISVNNV